MRLNKGIEAANMVEDTTQEWRGRRIMDRSFLVMDTFIFTVIKYVV